MRLLFLTLLATVFLVPVAACGQPTVSQSLLDTASTPQTQMQERNAWQNNQALYRVAFTVEATSPTKGESLRWFAVERTPNHRLKVLSRTSPTDPHEVTFLEQEGAIVAIVEGNATQLVAPWVMGTYLYDEALSPEMMLSWVTGLAGQSYSKDYPKAQLKFDDNNLSSLSQNGWDVSFHEWGNLIENAPRLPHKMTACKNNTCLSITVDDMNVFQTPPNDYKEFSIF